jgi:hypothetical protein
LPSRETSHRSDQSITVVDDREGVIIPPVSGDQEPPSELGPPAPPSEQVHRGPVRVCLGIVHLGDLWPPFEHTHERVLRDVVCLSPAPGRKTEGREQPRMMLSEEVVEVERSRRIRHVRLGGRDRVQISSHRSINPQERVRVYDLSHYRVTQRLASERRVRSR